MKKVSLAVGLLMVFLLCTSVLAEGQEFVVTKEGGLSVYKSKTVFIQITEITLKALNEGKKGPFNTQLEETVLEKVVIGEIIRLPKGTVVEISEKHDTYTMGEKTWVLYTVRPEGSVNDYLALIKSPSGEFYLQRQSETIIKPTPENYTVAKEDVPALCFDFFLHALFLHKIDEKEIMLQLVPKALISGEMVLLRKGLQVQILKKKQKGDMNLGAIGINGKRYWANMDNLERR